MEIITLNKANHTVTTIHHICQQQLEQPVFAFRPRSIAKAVSYFQQNLAAKILYAVKTNPAPLILKQLVTLGVRCFDVASINEIKLIYDISPELEIFYMHPVKSRHAISQAYFEFGVRHFCLDSMDELHKILQQTHFAKDLILHMRLAIPNTYAQLSLADKFGIDAQSGPQLLSVIAKHAKQVGICFHVGSQCMHPDAYKIAIDMSEKVIRNANVNINYFNVGGGFPSAYPSMQPPALTKYFSTIHQCFSQLTSKITMQLLAEPGRALVAESGSLIVRVDLRKQDKLYINDGTYGGLFDAGFPQFIFPTKLIETSTHAAKTLLPYSFYGPTCDSLDYMKGPFYLPENIQEGDYIEIGQLGAYSHSLSTQFNGFQHHPTLFTISDEPLLTMYNANQYLAA